MRKRYRGKMLKLRPIGHVQNWTKPGEDVVWETIDSRIVVDEQWADGLEGLEEFSHIIVVFWLDRPGQKELALKVHPEARDDVPLVGVFATRSPRRPNPLALTTVRLLAREGNTLYVRGLDAFDGTPVLDIKPYLTRGDRQTAVSVPQWLVRLWEEQDREAKR